MKNSPAVAVVILNWNGADFLRNYLPPLIQYTQIPNVRLIVADNGSTDNSASVVEKEFSSIEFLALPKNYGFALGYNEALKQIESDYYVLLNSDVEVAEHWLSPMIDLMEQDADIAACQPKILAEKERYLFEYAGAGGGMIDQFGYPFCRGRVMDHCEEDQGQYNDARQIFWGSGACLMVRADEWHLSQGFDIDFWAHFEEIDLCWRMQNRGKKIYYCGESTVYHLGGGSLSYDNPRKLFLNFRNNLFLLYKNLPSKNLLPILFFRMILDGVAALQFLVKGKTKSFAVVFEAHMTFYKQMKSLRAKRKELLTERKPNLSLPIYKGSIVFDYFIRGKQTFTEIWK